MQTQQYKINSPEFPVILSLLDAVKQISISLHSPVISLETINKFGDKQLHQDVHTDQLVEKHLRKNLLVKGFASQERPQYHSLGEGQGYVVTYDPLDGSSIIDTNFSVGSIFSIWPTTQHKLIGTKIKDQVNAMLAVYGPRTTVILYNSQLQKVQQLTLLNEKWLISHQNLKINPKTKMFSPGNLRAISQHQGYKQIVHQWMQKGYTLRYTGGLVPDIAQIFIKGHGIFANVASKSFKSKLRVLYEIAAVGFLVHKADGNTVTLNKINLLELEIKTFDDRTSFAAGSAQQIEILSKIF